MPWSLEGGCGRTAFAERCNGKVDKGVRLDVWAVRGAEPATAIGYIVQSGDGGGVLVNEDQDEADWPTFNAATKQLE